MNLYQSFKQQEAEILRGCGKSDAIEYEDDYVCFSHIEEDNTIMICNDCKSKLSQFYKDNLFWASKMILIIDVLQVDVEQWDYQSKIILTLKQIKEECQKALGDKK